VRFEVDADFQKNLGKKKQLLKFDFKKLRGKNKYSVKTQKRVATKMKRTG